MTQFLAPLFQYLPAVVTAVLACTAVNGGIYLWWRANSTRMVKSTTQPQDFHSRPAPRSGGIGLYAGIAAGLLVAGINTEVSTLGLLFIIALLPAFCAGIFEDVTKRDVSPWLRLGLTMVSAIVAIFLLDARFTHTGIYFLDQIFTNNTIFSVACILLVITGAAHSTNVIDGFHGLMAGFGMIACVPFIWIALVVGDNLMAGVFLILFAALLGFMVLNYPKGIIFSGDSGAYLLGTSLALAAILLLQRNQKISPWFAVVLLSYPVGETLFSIIRKRLILGKPAMQPDEYHMHMIIHRLIKRRIQPANPNAMTSTFLWPLTIIPAIAACIYPFNTKVLIIICLGYGAIYICLYVILVMREIMKYR